MTEPIKYYSAFTGIGGFDLAFDRAGMECVGQVELNPHRRAVLEKHWPNVPRGTDVRDISGTDVGRPDLIVGGFPCQDISIGKARRKGLAGDESSLYWEFQRLVAEHLRLVDATRPRWTVLENVPNLTEFNGGRDLAAVLLGLEVLGYGWSYRVVDSRGVGSAQRRPRILIVGHLGGDPRPAVAVLADREAAPGSAEVRGEPAGDVGPGVRPSADEGVAVFRKRANPRKKAVEGGWASYERATYFNTLTKNDSGTNLRQKHIVLQTPAGGEAPRLRALTPVEWERLQGFPDNWTEGIPERERFAACGDALNVDMGTWLANRIVTVDRAVPMIGRKAA